MRAFFVLKKRIFPRKSQNLPSDLRFRRAENLNRSNGRSNALHRRNDPDGGGGFETSPGKVSEEGADNIFSLEITHHLRSDNSSKLMSIYLPHRIRGNMNDTQKNGAFDA